ncbi:MAG: acyltransferase family protein [Saprospiraceae bacterium]
MLKYFQRYTNTTRFIPEIDGLRFFAIITVVVFHLNTTFSEISSTDWRLELGMDHPLYAGWWIVRLDLGVKVFFAISGFILAIPFLKHFLFQEKKVALGDYFYRRLTRLEPPFILSLVGFYGVHVFVLGENAGDLFPAFMAGLFYLHAFVFGVPSIINPVTWSLETEAQFYVLIPLFFLLFAVMKKKWFAIGFLIAIAALSFYWKSAILNGGPANLKYSILIYISNFITGIFFGWIYLKYPAFIQRKNLIWDATGLIAVFLLFYFYKPQAYWLNNFVFNVATFLIFIAAFKGILSNRFYRLPLVYTLGGMCYTIYLLHYALLHLLVKFTSSLAFEGSYLANLVVQFLLCTPFLLVVCGVFFLLIEKPCMDKNWPSLALQKAKKLMIN